MSINQTMPVIRRLSNKLDDANQQMDVYLQGQAKGEAGDGAEFLKMLEQRTVTQKVMEAQLKLNEKPLKTVMTESR
ncbi:hypothetical protein [Paraherbaspirillum soli]|uniref:DUF2383 domain-containing protein n=1 Tax=Paraherbaspirillum soli TaxID=631222 RepID=A0ABW0M751_9BURK